MRGADLDLAFTNRACAGGAIEDPLRDLARRARTKGEAVAEPHLLSVGGAERLLEVTETPVEGWAGTAGFAIDRSQGGDTEETSPGHAAARDQVLQNLATAIAIFGPDTRLRFFNAAYADLWRVDAGWLDSEPGLAEVLERLRELRRLPEYADFRAFKEEQIARFGSLAEPVDSLLHLPDGTTLRSVVSPYALGGLVFTYENVTDRLDLERSYNTLIAVQRATLDNLYEGVAVFGSDGRLKLSNSALAELWNLSEEDLGGEPHLSDFVEKMRPFIIGEDDWAAHKERVIKRMMSRESSSGRLLRGDGTVLDYANLPLPDGAVLLSYLNVTDSVRVQFALRQRAEAMEEANRLKSAFIANVSYEVRTPLNTIVGFAEILAEEYFGKLNQRQMEYSRGIVEASQNLTTVISDILDLASIEAGTMALELDTVDLHTMLASVLNLTRERARRKSLKVEFDCPPDIGWMVADEKRIKQVLFNLLSNAVAFTPPHGTIGLSAWRDGDDIAIAVSDTGVGIPQADQERVLRTFERGGAPDARQGGAGLGLSLVTSFIELHGGRVEVKSAPNKGTTVTCRLPSGGGEEKG
ncbi:MAG: PAS-domain containing protein [Proteobacteria bacterium]|nr:PAS-domain containing protein [Pseudomonadota bacterium]